MQLKSAASAAHETTIDDLCDAPIERKTARPPAAPSAPAAPAIANPEVRALADRLDAQSAQLEALAAADTAPATPAMRTVQEIRNRRLEDLRQTVDARDREVRRTGRSDVVRQDEIRRGEAAVGGDTGELKRLRREVSELKRRAARPTGPTAARGASTNSDRSAAFALHRKAVEIYVRTGQEVFNGIHLRDIERRAMTTEIAPDGGFLVHPEHDEGPIEKKLRLGTVMRQVATVRPISSASFKKPWNKGGIAGGWVGETEERPDTDTPQLAEREFPAMEMFAKPKASQTTLDDAMIDVEAWLADEVADKFIEMEDLAFISGNTPKRPKGVLAYDKVLNASWVDDKIGYVITGVSGGFPAVGAQVNQGDVIKGLVHGLRKGYRQNALFMMNRATIGTAATLKDGTGQWVFKAGEKGEDDKLSGYSIEEAEQFPDIGADTFSIAFGDFRKGYIIVDRLGLRVLRNPYIDTPYVVFHTIKRVGGGVQNFEAIKLLKFGTG